MRKKIISILVLMLLITTSISVLGSIDRKDKEKIFINLDEEKEIKDRGSGEFSSWYIGYYREPTSDVPGLIDATDKARDRLINKGWIQRYYFGTYDSYAWQWEYATERTYVDCSDLAMFSGHGTNSRKCDPNKDYRALMFRQMISDYKLRIINMKKKSVEAFNSLNYDTIAVGDSYNDVGMLKIAKHGI